MNTTTQVIWFKRDLRISDHKPLTRAIEHGPCICLYAYEPELLASPECDASHIEFINQSLSELGVRLREIGGRLVVRVGDFPAVFEDLYQQNPFSHLWSHEETGNHITYMRDVRVAQWCRERGVMWKEFPQSGVVRRLNGRDGWSGRWLERMNEPLLPKPSSMKAVPVADSGSILSPVQLGLSANTKNEMQIGGESRALGTLSSFLGFRGVNYAGEMSSPVTAGTSCSRLSPYLAWGNVSMKTVFQATRTAIDYLKDDRKAGRSVVPTAIKSLNAFAGRLRWHCHFMQKLEDEPQLEFRNMSRSCDGLRENEFNPAYFDAWCRGQTGYPMVDACMRALHQSGWINFRMRAMLVSFASYDLWLHWRPTSLYLAQHFLDFEPGIHYSQFQMQSGTTGINTLRIYSPTKQIQDHDPNGEFIKMYVPELRDVPSEYLAEPATMPNLLQKICGCVIGTDYPRPIVTHREAVSTARKRFGRIRKSKEAREEAARIQSQHGSRKKGKSARTVMVAGVGAAGSN